MGAYTLPAEPPAQSDDGAVDHLRRLCAERTTSIAVHPRPEPA
jgi:hypothetical protein